MKLKGWVIITVSVGLFIASHNLGAYSTEIGDDSQLVVDTIVTYGVSIRAEEPDPANLASSSGNRNFDQWDAFSHILKATHDIQWRKGSYGLFARGNYFYDFAAASANLSPKAEDLAVTQADITDFYAFAQLGEQKQYSVKAGKQVISWGESTFIGGSLNIINTFDLTKLRQPGVQLKDALLGTPALWANWTMTPTLSIEGFVLGSFDAIELDPAGTFFSTTDAISPGGTGTLGPLRRAPNDKPSASGQYGLALRYTVADWNMEVGGYYLRVHEHAPVFSSVSGSNEFFVTYPEATEVFGLSFNTNVGSWAVSGEYSHRRNAPLQGIEFFGAGLGRDPRFPIGTRVDSFERIERNQIQVTGQKQWSQAKFWFGADSFDTLGEVAYGWQDLPGSYVPFNPVTDDFAGLVLRNSLTYNNVFNFVNLIPAASFSWDIDGLSNDVTFVDGRKSLVLSLGAAWRINWTANLAYTTFWDGTGPKNNLTGGKVYTAYDRDFISFDVSYAF